MSTDDYQDDYQDELEGAWSTTPEDSALQLEDDLQQDDLQQDDETEGYDPPPPKPKPTPNAAPKRPLSPGARLLQRERAMTPQREAVKKPLPNQMTQKKMAAAKFLAGIVRMLENSPDPDLGYLSEAHKRKYKTVIFITHSGKLRIVK